jgi:hypothetical protein
MAYPFVDIALFKYSDHLCLDELLMDEEDRNRFF